LMVFPKSLMKLIELGAVLKILNAFARN
jgi:hypothetical protein